MKSLLFALLVLTGLSSNAQVNIDSLVAFYPLNGNVNDYSGRDNHGYLHGGIFTIDSCPSNIRQQLILKLE